MSVFGFELDRSHKIGCVFLRLGYETANLRGSDKEVCLLHLSCKIFVNLPICRINNQVGGGEEEALEETGIAALAIKES